MAAVSRATAPARCPAPPPASCPPRCPSTRLHARLPTRHRRRLPRPVAHRRVQRAGELRDDQRRRRRVQQRARAELRRGHHGEDMQVLAHAGLATCPPTSYSMFFKGLCASTPTATPRTTRPAPSPAPPAPTTASTSARRRVA
ncbi:hypothetical protein DAI22_04g070150 [Oryza sativa Japonica Group]|nr:hypothetical protein DAI22_04g070150 [Oryza sativa Japonica Group]